MTYVLVAYRENHSDYCKGCFMGSSDSELDMEVFTSEKDLSRKIGAIYFENHQSKHNYDYADTEAYFIYNGVIYSFYGDYTNDEMSERIYKDALAHKEMLIEVHELEEQRRKERELEEKLREKEEREIQKVKDDLKLLEELKQKYEGIQK